MFENLTLRFWTWNLYKSTDLGERFENDTNFFENGWVVVENELSKVGGKSEKSDICQICNAYISLISKVVQ